MLRIVDMIKRTMITALFDNLFFTSGKEIFELWLNVQFRRCS